MSCVFIVIKMRYNINNGGLFKTLDEVIPGMTVVIETVGGKGLLRRRLLEMGLTPKTKIKVRKVAPMGDPIEVYLRSYVLTLRKDDASKIAIKEVSDE